MIGTVVSVSREYGFIRPDGGDETAADFFFSVPACWGVPRVGSRVEFDELHSEKPRARNVKVLKFGA